MRNYPSLLVLLSLATPFARADIVMTSISQTVSSSGVVRVFAHGNMGILAEDSYNFSDTNFLLPPVFLGASGSAHAAADSRNVTAASSASQQADVTLNHIGLQMGTNEHMSGLGPHVQGIADDSSQFSLLFDLSNPSLVHLTGVGSGYSSSSSSMQDQFQLSGPAGFQFERLFQFPSPS